MRITLPLPPSINRYYSTNVQGRRFKTRLATNWENEAGYTLMEQNKFKKIFGKREVVVTYRFYFKDNRSDYGNRTKILDDLLQKTGIIDNDKQIMEAHIYKHIDSKNMRVEVEIQGV